jgi:HEAT repeat protein
LQRKDTCSLQLKRSALFMLVRRGDSVATNALIAVATNNSEDTDLRTDAISYLGRMSGDAGLPTLENLVRTSTDDQIQRAAVRALAQNDSPRAHQGVRALIERPDASESLRSEAILSLAGSNGSTDDAAYLRSIYTKMPSERLKSAVLRALARAGGADNVQFMLSVAGNTSESSEVRGTAIQFASRDSSVSVGALNKLYDAAESRNVREQLIYALGRRSEPAAADKLMDIVRTSTDPYARREAVNVLSRKKDDPRVTKFLLDLVGK